ncbi:MAG: radical SAM protein [Candidatus Omnitrophica bacterium]|nr:radical SAM protein [Candidatus Omnitrophota bacterium]
MLIKSINWIITDACNLRCKHCDIWKLPAKMATNNLVQKLLADTVVEKSYAHYGKAFDISLGGGEPFAHPELQEIVAKTNQKYPGALKSISTNGVLTKRIFLFLKNNPGLNLKINISVDGLKEIHDQIRGIQGAFQKTIQTIRVIKRVFPYQRIEMKMTIMRDNVLQIAPVYQLSRKLGCSFSCKPADSLDNYTNRNSKLSLLFKEEEVCSIRNQAFSVADGMLKNKEYKKARFTKDIPFHISGKRKHPSCSVLWEHITVMANGDVFFCIKEKRVGNILDNYLIAMETAPKEFLCKSCMLMCGSFKDYDEAPYDEKVANIEATLKCNLRCSMCTQKELQTPGETMSFEPFSDLARKNAFDHVSFVGGESFMNTDIFRMMDLLDSKGISYELTTNGTLFTGSIKKKLKACIGLKKINFSLDGLEKYHDAIRGKGVFKKAVKALMYSNKYWNIAVASIIRADNLSILLDLRKYLNAHDISSQKFIYVMNISGPALQDSLKRVPGLKIQGPKCNDQVRSACDLERLFSELEGIAPDVSFEPRIMRTDTEEFLKDEPIGECKQLRQLRYNPEGERIICEFIRNAHAAELQNSVQGARLPICAHCCKMDSLK